MIVRIMNSKSSQCRQCGGSIALGKDQFGDYLQCIMCGRNVEIRLDQGKPDHRSNPVISANALNVLNILTTPKGALPA